MSELSADRWLDPQNIAIVRPPADEISRDHAMDLLEPALSGRTMDSLVHELRQPQIPVTLGGLSLVLTAEQMVGDGGIKRVYSLPGSPYVIGVPNRTKSNGTILQWPYVIQEPEASQHLHERTGVLTNPDAYLAEGSVGSLPFPFLVMRDWESFNGVVLDSKSPYRSDRFTLNFAEPPTDIADIRKHLDPAVADVDELLASNIRLGADSLNLIASGDEAATTRVFASEIIDAILHEAAGKPLNIEDTRRQMICRVVDTFFAHAMSRGDYFKRMDAWERLIKAVTASYGVNYGPAAR